ncbi:GTP-binding protein RAD isoform X1 [Phlebotomus argentipes]|uniref:GTP-binding protein RAD isoform X1 n=1 Tax=Phlebotomus argentipes TaxID=94469 RepID=UPI00289369B5|nr:GTP-binding protein RAD isoform X1 [Phlebotomus argentipes]
MDDISPHSRINYTKTRSASICAPASTSLENVLLPPSGSGTPDNGTPSYRRRRPATRSQSARITGARSVKRKTQPPPSNLQETSRSHCTSEPRLNDTETPPQRRRGSQRRPTHTQSQRKPTTTFLDVPSNFQYNPADDDDDNYRLRTFSSTKGGVINRGDSFRRRRSRSNSLVPTSPIHARAEEAVTTAANVETFQVAMLGAPGVGKAALVSQFRTSECINAYEGPESIDEQNISIILNGIESELNFLTWRGNKDELEKADAFLVVYSVVDKASFSRAEQLISMLQDMDLVRSRGVILVGNKIDLARSRAVSAQDGKCLACTFRAKFIEVSVGINHNVDELLAGTLTQIRLKKEHSLLQGSREGSSPHWYKSRSVMRASMKARQMITWILGKEDSKFRNCENLQIL